MLARPSLDRDLHRALVEAGYAPLNEYAEEYMTQLQWQPAPHRKNKVDQFADVPGVSGRYLIRKNGKEFRVTYNGHLVSFEPTLDDAIRRAEVGASLLLRREIWT